MFVLELVVGVAVLVGIAFVASRDVDGLGDADEEPDLGLPVGRPLRSGDIDRLRFRVVGGWRGAVRGYRFADVDRTLDAVRETLRGYEAERHRRPGAPAAPAGAPDRADDPPGR